VATVTQTSKSKKLMWTGIGLVLLAIVGCGGGPAKSALPSTTPPASGAAGWAVGPQYDSVHVYVPDNQVDTFTRSWIATFGGTTSTPVNVNVTPVPSNTKSQLVLSPVGTLSVFGYTTPVPHPFGTERTGWLVTDLDAGVKAAVASGAATIVAPFNDPIGRDAIIEFPGGVNTQLYWHNTRPSYPALNSLPDHRVYLSPDALDPFLRSYLRFTQGRISADDRNANGALIGKPNTAFREIRIASPFGNTVVLVTDGHLPYPYGWEIAGYRVADVGATISKAQAAGAAVLAPPAKVGDSATAILRFPGGYIAEIHS
jgi:hypothetical protein